MCEIVHGGDIVVVSLKRHVRVDVSVQGENKTC